MDINEQDKKRRKSKKKLIDRMMNAYRKRKRQEKIDKLEDNPNLWKNLQ